MREQHKVPAPPPDLTERIRALAVDRSILVQAPAGSGKTTLLTLRYLRLLAQAEDPEEIVAITFTRAAAAEMRNRILEALETAAERLARDPDVAETGALDTETLALAAMRHAEAMGWQLLDQPSQLRVTTIDSFCRALAQRRPLEWELLSSLGGQLDLAEQADFLYRRAARRMIDLLHTESEASQALKAVLLWRDNNWKDTEDLIVEMLKSRSRWYGGLVFNRETEAEELRAGLEAPLGRIARRQLVRLSGLLENVAGAGARILELARFACQTPGKDSPLVLEHLTELPGAPFHDMPGDIQVFGALARFLLAPSSRTWRKKVDKNQGFPAGGSSANAKAAFESLIRDLEQVPGLRESLAAFLNEQPLGYSEAEWEIVLHCFTLLRSAYAQLQLLMAETGTVDFPQVARIALDVLATDGEEPSDFAIELGEEVTHLLIDEFQDTSRIQLQLVERILSGWPQREGRTVFCVGDPMQSIYGFRDAEVELFQRVGNRGIAMHGPDDTPLELETVQLAANFRTQGTLVEAVNEDFLAMEAAEHDPGGIALAPAVAVQDATGQATTLSSAFHLGRKSPVEAYAPEVVRAEQLQEIVARIRETLAHPEPQEKKWRVAVLASKKKSLVEVAEVLRGAGIPYRAVDIVPLSERPEVLDALALGRALLNPNDRTAWLGVLRAPWCALTLADMHLLTSGDDATQLATPIPELLRSRLPQMSGMTAEAARAAARVARLLEEAQAARAALATMQMGTWLQMIFNALGGDAALDAEGRENLRLLWRCLDGLPNGEQDLLDRSEDTGILAALKVLFAQPDPNVSPDHGVQLMTIHKSKGLEFEVVLLVDLEARSKGSDKTLISWLERGVAEPEAGEPETEFLIAPISPKGEEPSNAKRLVDGIKLERSRRELRRLLYVAMTRARRELHLFARVACSYKDGAISLGKPQESLLGTGWPAWEARVQEQFQQWLPAVYAGLAVPSGAIAIAAGAESNVLQFPAPVAESAPEEPRVTRLRRIPYAALPAARVSAEPSGESSMAAEEEPFARTQGGLESRIAGNAIHLLLDELSRLRQTLDPAQAAAALDESLPRLLAEIRSAGVAPKLARNLAGRALETARAAAVNPTGAWILAPHAEAGSEARWTGMVSLPGGGSQLRNLRPDRIFRAVPMDEPDGAESWWIIDYKTATASDLTDAAARARFLASHRELYEPQLATYATILREWKGAGIAIRAGLFYPRPLLFDSWET